MLKYYEFWELPIGIQFRYLDRKLGKYFWCEKMSSRTSRVMGSGTLCWHGKHDGVQSGAL